MEADDASTACTAKQVRSFEERLAAISEFALAFNEYLESNGGIVLPANIRLNIAHSARDLLLIPAGERAGMLTDAPVNDSATTKSFLLTNIVDTLINRQHEANEVWYQATVQSLAIFVPECCENSLQRVYYTHVVFSEIVLVATMAHSVHSFYLAIGKDAPELPKTVKKDATPPSLFDWTQVLKSQKEPRQNKAQAFAPYLLSDDVRADAQEFDKLKLPDVQMDFLRWTSISPPPYICVQFAVNDYVWLQRWFDIAYLVKGPPGAFKRFFLAYLPLDTTHRCTESVTRHDLEVMAYHVAATNGCGY
jgi:hypothetical protein